MAWRNGQTAGPLQAILLDLDGTLVDSAELDAQSMSRLFRTEFDRELRDEELRRYLGMTSRDILLELAPERVDELLAKWIAIQDDLREQIHLFPGVYPMLHLLSRTGFDLAVVTSQNQAELEATRAHIDLDELIGVWVSADDAHRPKPDPAPILLALEMIACAPDKAIMIGDTYFDMEAGREAGTLIGAALWGAHEPEKLLGFQPDFIFHNPEELKRLCPLKKR